MSIARNSRDTKGIPMRMTRACIAALIALIPAAFVIGSIPNAPRWLLPGMVIGATVLLLIVMPMSVFVYRASRRTHMST